MNIMKFYTRLFLVAAAALLSCISRSVAQKADPFRNFSPDRIAGVPFTLSPGTTESGAAMAGALPPQSSSENWAGGLGRPGVDGDVRAMVWNDGQLYIGGDFFSAAGVDASHVARWDGSAWHPLGTEFANGVNGDVRAIAVEGDKVYVAGEFTHAGGLPARNIAVWDNSTSTWSTLGGGVGGLLGSAVNAIAVHNGQVYVGGRFIAAGTTVAVNIARWNGSRWERVGTGINDAVTALYIDGDMLYAGGSFTIAGNISSPNLARFNISTNTWENSGAAISGKVASMTADAQYLYVGGTFKTINGRTMNNISRLNKSTGEWSAMGQGFTGEVKTILLRGGDVIVGGEISGLVGRTLPRGYDVRRIAKWNGTEWSVFARRSALSGTNHGSSGVIKASRAAAIDDPDIMIRDNGEGIVYALTQDNAGTLYIGGSFDLAGPAYIVPLLTPSAARIIPDPEMIAATNICRLSQNDTVWTTVGGGLDNHVYAMADDGSHLYVGGKFVNAAQNRVNHITRFNKETRDWEIMGGGVNGDVLALAMDGTSLYVGGDFRSAGGTSASGLARWDADARSWSRVGNYDFDAVTALAVVNGDLYAGGPGGLARWNGTTWTTLYNGGDGPVNALLRDGGTLYVGGSFNSIGTVRAKNIAALNIANDQWSEVGTGTNGPVYALSMWNGELCIGGKFTQAGTISTLNIAVWNPSNGSWKELSGGVNGEVRAVTTGRFGLYVAGNFRALGNGVVMNSIALWDGTIWQQLGGGVLELVSLATVHALVANDDYLYVGGTHHYSGGKTAFYLARWTYPPLNSITQENTPVQRQNIAPSAILGTLYPNPIPDKGTFRLQLTRPTDLTADIFNAAGERVIAVTTGSFDVGIHELPVNAGVLPDGLYFLRIVTGQETQAQPFIVRH